MTYPTQVSHHAVTQHSDHALIERSAEHLIAICWYDSIAKEGKDQQTIQVNNNNTHDRDPNERQTCVEIQIHVGKLYFVGT